MWDWLQRQDQRDRELDQGVDADLVQGSVRRWQWCDFLHGIWLLGFIVLDKVKLSGAWRSTVATLTIIALVISAIVSTWARLETGFSSDLILKSLRVCSSNSGGANSFIHFNLK